MSTYRIPFYCDAAFKCEFIPRILRMNAASNTYILIKLIFYIKLKKY